MTMSSNIIPNGVRAAISIRDMADQCGLSRQRFMQLVKVGVFPEPQYDVATKRPFYTEEMQGACLDVRRRNFGVNGKVVMFYARRSSTPSTVRPKKPKDKPAGVDRYAEVVDGLKTLGLTTITAAQAGEAVRECFPGGTTGIEPGQVIRAVFLHLRGKNRNEKVGRKESFTAE